MRIAPWLGLTTVLLPALATAQEFKVEVLKEAAPEALAGPIRETLEAQGYRVLVDGKPYADYWFRKGVPASAKPAGAKGSLLYPVLGEGELLGAARYAAEGQDFRDQVIAPGVYTLRYGLRLDDGNHANVSPYKDYALLLPADKDKELAPLAVKALQKASALASGTTHPAVLNLASPPSKAPASPTLTHAEMENLWGLVAPITLNVAGDSGSNGLIFHLIVSGMSAG